MTSALESIRNTVNRTFDGVRAFSDKIDTDPEFATNLARAVELIGNHTGRVILTGIGKSGHIGRKIAATMASTGTPAYFVHPTEASHGDLGMIGPQDVIICLSWSGETLELGNILAYAKRFRVPLISVTSNGASLLARNATVPLNLPKVLEACPHNLAPTTSTMLQLLVGDALAIALLERRGFSATDFKVFHPGGKLGAQLVLVDEIAHGADNMPIVPVGTAMGDVVVIMSAKGFGVVGVVDVTGRLVGIVTDGDLRRHMRADLMLWPVEDVMSRAPRAVDGKTMASDALRMMETENITVLFVVDGAGRPVGVLHVLDLLRVGVA
ncbi:KpsF/GutQ family sugar-phosphate isomerase [Xanthobacter sp. V4C-4]|uniref:KpsF/GutQ family sugar-phosphate isomerase n=1 Tax=Xanthobacter cornucopiae TaxID=3119924 RepID=UPI003726D741